MYSRVVGRGVLFSLVAAFLHKSLKDSQKGEKHERNERMIPVEIKDFSDLLNIVDTAINVVCYL